MSRDACRWPFPPNSTLPARLRPRSRWIRPSSRLSGGTARAKLRPKRRCLSSPNGIGPADPRPAPVPAGRNDSVPLAGLLRGRTPGRSAAAGPGRGARHGWNGRLRAPVGVGCRPRSRCGRIRHPARVARWAILSGGQEPRRLRFADQSCTFLLADDAAGAVSTRTWSSRATATVRAKRWSPISRPGD